MRLAVNTVVSQSSQATLPRRAPPSHHSACINQVMPEFQLSTKGMKSPPPNVFASLDGKTKSAVTRAYNAIAHKSQALVETLQAPKKAKKRKAPPKSVAMGEVRD